MNYILETPRLRLREFSLADTTFVIELLNTPGWLQYIGDRNVRTEEQARAYLENGPLKSYRTNGYGLSLVERREDKIPVGMCGMINRENLDCPDIGFAFLPDYHGHGYAIEMVRTTMLYAKKQLQLAVICAITLPDNFRSIQLLEKIGMKFDKTFRFPGGAEDLLLYKS